eukprot:GGOE01057643.1.p1 GENE.GGOE01057643.1~~GGOE01057643.1.p1  ORF type:complete len:209 (+),score=24.43 GGOE01057643.1:1326-1952(+)
MEVKRSTGETKTGRTLAERREREKNYTWIQRIGRSPDFWTHAFVYWPFIAFHLYICNHTIPMRILYFCLGAFVQSFVEYVSHAWVFHGPLWKMHGGHHKRPGDHAKLLVPLPFSIAFAILLYISFGSFVTFDTLAALTVGDATWYMLFEYIHYTSHYPQHLKLFQMLPMFKDLQKFHRAHHHEHEFKDGNYKYYGFTTTFWDHVFGTI